MKTVYFIRHAESEENIGPIQQGAVTPLTKKGKDQAKIVAKRCKSLSIGLIISSTMIRAVETANVIAKKISKQFETSGLFVERKRPSEVLGKPKDDPESIRIGNLTWDNFHISDFRHSDEENFEDIKKRAREALKYLESKNEDNILVVTHGFFMRIVMAYILFGDKLTAYECQQCIRVFHMENTGITTLCYDKDRTPTWWLEVWNDHAHLW